MLCPCGQGTEGKGALHSAECRQCSSGRLSILRGKAIPWMTSHGSLDSRYPGILSTHGYVRQSRMREKSSRIGSGHSILQRGPDAERLHQGWWRCWRHPVCDSVMLPEYDEFYLKMLYCHLSIITPSFPLMLSLLQR